MAKLKDSLTVLYYTSNHEEHEFEQKIIQNLKAVCGDLHIISVSQKPISLGKNICVGDVGLSYLNEWRQMYLGAKEVKTPYIVFAESDHLYPKEYFNFVPPRAGAWHYENIWTVFKDVTRAGSYRRKLFSDGAQICDTKSLLERLERFLADKPMWGIGEYDEHALDVHFDYFSGDTPCIVFKTGDGVSNSANVINTPGQGNMKNSLPHWGHVNNLRATYFG